jgi:hypothetical protein
MKRSILLCLFILFLTGLELNAQVFVGGGLGISTSKSKSTYLGTTTDGDKYFDLNFSPKVGFFLGKKLALGMGLDLWTSKVTEPNTGESEETVNKSSGWSVGPFVRYYFAEAGNFSFFGEGALGIGGSKSKSTVGSNTTEGPKYFNVAFGVSPNLSYKLSDKVALEAGLGSLGFYSSTGKQKYGSDEAKQVSSGFGLNLDMTALSFSAIIML